MNFPENKPQYFYAGMCGSCVYCPGCKEIETIKQSYCAAVEESITLVSHEFCRNLKDQVAVKCSTYKLDAGLGVLNSFESRVRNLLEVQGVDESVFDAFLKATMDGLIAKMIKELGKQWEDDAL